VPCEVSERRSLGSFFAVHYEFRHNHGRVLRLRAHSCRDSRDELRTSSRVMHQMFCGTNRDWTPGTNGRQALVMYAWSPAIPRSWCARTSPAAIRRAISIWSCIFLSAAHYMAAAVPSGLQTSSLILPSRNLGADRAGLLDGFPASGQTEAGTPRLRLTGKIGAASIAGRSPVTSVLWNSAAGRMPYRQLRHNGHCRTWRECPPEARVAGPGTVLNGRGSNGRGSFGAPPVPQRPTRATWLLDPRPPLRAVCLPAEHTHSRK